MHRPLIVATAILILQGTVSFAQSHPICGDPPPVADETLKADIEGKAQLLSRFIGDASLTGQIATSRTEVLSKYGDRSDAYFQYQMCVLIMDDDDISNQEKRDELRKLIDTFKTSIDLNKEQSLCDFNPDYFKSISYIRKNSFDDYITEIYRACQDGQLYESERYHVDGTGLTIEGDTARPVRE